MLMGANCDMVEVRPLNLPSYDSLYSRALTYQGSGNTRIW